MLRLAELVGKVGKMNPEARPAQPARPAFNPTDWISRHWPAALFLVPLLRVLFLSTTDGDFSSWQVSARLFFMIALFVEIGVFVAAVLNGMSIASILRKLPQPIKIMIFIWLAIVWSSILEPRFIPGVAVRGALFWTTHLLFAAAVGYLLMKAHKRGFSLQNHLIILPISTALTGMFMLLFVYGTGLNSDFNWGEHMPGYGNLRHTGYVFAPAIALSLAHLAAVPTRQTKMHIVLLFLNTALMLWLGSRGPVLGIGIAMLLCCLCFSEFRNPLFLLRGGLATCLGALASIPLPAPANAGFGAIQRFWDKGLEPEGFTSGRTEIWMETVALIKDEPWFGYGAHHFQFVSEHAALMFKHPHQSILQFLFDWGFVGAALFFVLIGYLVFLSFVRSRCPREVKIISATLLLSLSCYSLVDGVFFYPFTIAVGIVFLLWPLIAGANPDRSEPGR